MYTKRSSKKKVIFMLLFLIVVVSGIGVLGAYVQNNLRIRNSGALYGGSLEKGYPSAGYLISTEPSGAIKTCGYSAINSRIGVTAAHCVDNSAKIAVGLGDFSRIDTNHINVEKAVQREGWVESKDRRSDFSILTFENKPGFFQVFSSVVSPQEGCNYRVVAYGRTENASDSAVMPRKSALVCASDITASTFVLNGKDSGICFGDSGSPVYLNNTENLVGVVASIILQSDDPNKNPCEIGNKAIVVRADANERIINEAIANVGSGNPISVNASNTLVLDIKKENILEKLHLNNVFGNDVNLDYSTWDSTVYLMIGTVTLALVTFLAFLGLLLTGSSDNKNPENDIAPEDVIMPFS